MKKIIKEPILNRARNLFLIFLTTLGIITITNYSTTFLESNYHKRLDNQRAHEALGEEILTDLIALENEYNKLPSIEDTRDLVLAEVRINKLQTELLEIIQILQQGGHFRKNIPGQLKNSISLARMTTVCARKPGYLPANYIVNWVNIRSQREF